MKNIKDYLSITLNPFNVFIIIKPGFVKKSAAIIDIFKRNGYTIAKYIARRLDYDLAKELYKMHSEEPFYNDLCKYMSSDISVGYCLNYIGKGDPIEMTNKLKDEIREQFGKDEMKNAIHSSGSEANVVREAKIYFK